MPLANIHSMMADEQGAQHECSNTLSNPSGVDMVNGFMVNGKWLTPPYLIAPLS